MCCVALAATEISYNISQFLMERCNFSNELVVYFKWSSIILLHMLTLQTDKCKYFAENVYGWCVVFILHIFIFLYLDINISVGVCCVCALYVLLLLGLWSGIEAFKCQRILYLQSIFYLYPSTLSFVLCHFRKSDMEKCCGLTK